MLNIGSANLSGNIKYSEKSKIKKRNIIPHIKKWADYAWDPEPTPKEGHLPQYKIEYIKSSGGSFKPKMLYMELPSTVKTALSSGNALDIMGDLLAINSLLPQICTIVGELTFIVEKGKGLRMLDFSAGKKRAIDDIDVIRAGIQKIMQYVTERLDGQPAVLPAVVNGGKNVGIGSQDSNFVVAEGAPLAPPPP